MFLSGHFFLILDDLGGAADGGLGDGAHELRWPTEVGVLFVFVGDDCKREFGDFVLEFHAAFGGEILVVFGDWIVDVVGEHEGGDLPIEVALHGIVWLLGHEGAFN